MNGKYLLDTNVIINLLKIEKAKRKFIDKNPLFFLSIITEIELLSYHYLSYEDEQKIKKLLKKTQIINIDTLIKEETIRIRKQHNLKLPDAIICATAFTQSLCLVTDDKDLLKFSWIKSIPLKDLLL
ncbi:MAG TPA: type II toxin-antitoxin system VapC family toxin [Candidatus Eremiobacteraeota bacterium]|nr:MAG: PIN domain protein [bacterium ADurb.Bin363]HPZ07037.1 type II toxin-antitoxin system VapC family toxin [Candidatus Eremiobacteraeota bacterium]